jgi:hypothetical protein
MKLNVFSLWLAMCCIAAPAHAADVMVSALQPNNVKPGFFERIQSRQLAKAIKNRGRRVAVKSGSYQLRVPCDASMPGKFADVTVVLDNAKDIQFVDCGVIVGEHPGTRINKR